MCGICGMAFPDGKRRVDPALMKAMTDSMVHRGPDGGGSFLGPGVGLGMRRLSIIDLQTGDQPIYSEDGAIAVVCNGEIYNYLDLRRELLAAGHSFRTASDVEVIVHLYEQLGVACLDRLRGMFSFALWDARKEALFLARDRLGIKPLHYASVDGALYFASEQKPILAAGAVEPRVDPSALRDLFSLGFVGGAKTMCAGIRRLMPGHYLLYRRGDLRVEKYWELTFPDHRTAPRFSPDEWAEALYDKLLESVKAHLMSDVPLGATLSPGIDSSGVVSLMCKLLDRPVHTFSLAFENPAFDEVRSQGTLIDYEGYAITNEVVVCGDRDFELLPKALWYCEDVSTSGLEIPRMMLSELCARHVKVVLTGEGSDELFGGYAWYRVDKCLRPFASLPLWMRRLMLLGPIMPRTQPGASRIHLAPPEMRSERYRAMIGPFYPEYMDRLLSKGTKGLLESAGREEEDVALPEDFGRWHPFNQLQFHDLKLRLPDQIMRDLDRTSMAYSLEARVPFIDHEFIEFSSRIPPGLKMRRLEEKYILRRALRGSLPEEILRRKKRGLTAPFDQWLKGKLPAFAEDMLSEPSVRRKGYFDPAAVTELIRMHRSGQRRYGRHLMAVLITQLWDEVFIRNAGKGCPA